MPNGKLEKRPDSPPAAEGPVRVFSAGGGQVTPDGWSVNTSQPPWQPSGIPPAAGGSPLLADPAGTSGSGVPVPPQTAPTIGDRLSERGISWAWYAGAYRQALADGEQPAGVKRKIIYTRDNNSPNFQPHHQPFNYYARFAPGTADRAKHLLDGEDFMAHIAAGTLPAVSFYKPAGRDTQHPSYTDIVTGDMHIAGVLEKLRASPQWKDMLVIVTYDENGGYWDHVPPPSGPGWGDRFGPGTRIPTLVDRPARAQALRRFDGLRHHVHPQVHHPPLRAAAAARRARTDGRLQRRARVSRFSAQSGKCAVNLGKPPVRVQERAYSSLRCPPMALRRGFHQARQDRAERPCRDALPAKNKDSDGCAAPGEPRSRTTPPGGEPPRRRISRRATLVGSVIAILVVAGIGWLAWNLTHPDAPTAADGAPAGGGGRRGGGGAGGAGGGRGPATTVGIAVAERADIPITIDALGTVVPQATVRVRPQVTGVLQQVLYKEGQMVRKGELLAVIDPRQFEMSLQQASGQRMRDEAQLQAARVTLERFRTLLQQDSIARQEVDTQAALVKQLEGTVVSDKANEGTARLNLGYTRIVAPMAGRVGLRTVDVGNVVSSSDANGVAVITVVSPIDVEFAVPQDQAPMLQQNAGAFMEAKALDRTRQNVLDVGVFASLDNQVDTQTGTVRAKARFNNAKSALFPSQFVNVRLNVRTIKDAVVVPVAAVRNGNTGDYVFVLKDDRTVALRPVTRGQATVDKVQIATGLQVGERVITEGADRLRDGSRVVLPGDSPGAGRGPGGARRRGGADGAAPAASAPAGEASSPASGERASVPSRRGRRTCGAGRAARTGRDRGSGGAGDKPTAEQRQRLLDGAKGDPEQLERRKRLLEGVDRGDPQALERWRMIQQRRRDGAGGSQ